MAAGQDPSHFWGLTLRVIHAVLEGSAEANRRAHNDRAWQAHQTAFLTAYHPGKPGQFIALRKLQMQARGGAAARSATRSWEDDFAALSAWTSRGKPN